MSKAETTNSQNQDLQDEKMNRITENKSIKSANSENLASDKWEIPSDWEMIELGKLVDEKRPVSYGIVQTGELIEGGISCIRVTDIIDGKINTSNLITTSKKISDGYKRTLLRKGDLVMALRGKIGQIAKIENELVGANLTRGVALIALKDIYYNDFILHQISSDRTTKIFERNLNGSALQELSIGVVRKIPITLPKSLPEQIAIAQLLSTWDNAITKTQALIAQKEQRKKWLMQNLLTGQMRLKGFDGEWKECHLEEMFIERSETKYFDLPLLSVGSLGIYPQSDSVKKDTSNEDKSKYKRICVGDIGYNTMRMWQGRSALSALEGIISPAYTVIAPKKNADSKFFSYLFKTPKMTNLFWRNSQGLVDDTLNCKFKDFKIIKVLLPNKKEVQTAIAQVLQAADKEIQLLKTKCDKLKEQKKGLMQMLLTGKKRLII